MTDGDRPSQMSPARKDLCLRAQQKDLERMPGRYMGRRDCALNNMQINQAAESLTPRTDLTGVQPPADSPDTRRNYSVHTCMHMCCSRRPCASFCNAGTFPLWSKSLLHHPLWLRQAQTSCGGKSAQIQTSQIARIGRRAAFSACTSWLHHRHRQQ